MGTVNVRRDVEDQFYRYRMPKIVAKVEGKGNGIKTVVVNVGDVARALSRPPAFPTKFFGCELGAQVKCDEANDRYIVNGAHEASKLQDLLDGFISKFVLCNDCKNPETDIRITKDSTILKDCKACGKKTPADMRHKLTTYILKNPPPNAIEKKSKKDKSKKKGDEGDNILDQNSDDDIMTQKIQAQAAQAQIDAATSTLDSWSVDTSAEAVARRQKDAGLEEVEARMDKMMLMSSGGAGEDNDDDEGGAEEAFAAMESFLKENRDGHDADVLAFIEASKLPRHKSMTVVAQAFFTENVVAELGARSDLLQTLMTNKKCQKSFLGGLERLIGVSHPDVLLGKINVIFSTLYNEEIIEEETFMDWGAKASKKYVEKDISKDLRKRATKFLEWLETAEPESEEDDDDEDEDEDEDGSE